MTTGASKRVKFCGLEVGRYPGGRCKASVSLEHPDGRTVRETVEETAAGNITELRCSAQATLKGLGELAGDACSLSLLGVKMIKAFGAGVVIVALSASKNEDNRRLVGSVLVEENPERGAALAVLSATNRYLESLLFQG